MTLKLLVPNDHTGQTLSSHPTFFWYVSEAQVTNPTDSSIRADFLSLLDRAGLKEVAAQERQRLARN